MKNKNLSRKANLFGRRLRELRGSMTQKNMAEKLNITQPYLCELERGRRLPSLELLHSFARKLDVSIAFLMDWTEGERQTAANEERENSLAGKDVELVSDTLKIIRECRTSASIEMLLANAKHKLIKQIDGMRENDKAAIRSLLLSCLDILEENNA